MPIRINLLAEAQALEDLRRRDPVKRAIWASVLLVALLLTWSLSLQLNSMIASGNLSRVEGQITACTNEYKQVVESQNKLSDINAKLGALRQLSTNRLLYGTLLNAMQQTTVDDVQLIRLHADQSYAVTEAVAPKTNDDLVLVSPGRPAIATERILLTLEAKDSGVNPGDRVNRFKKALMDYPYFTEALAKTNGIRLASLSPQQSTEANKPFVIFTLECRYPEKTR